MTDAEHGSGLRARRRAQTERDIETAALEAFEARGFDATTMDEIAASAGVSVRTAFRYFPAKVDTVLFSARRVYELLGSDLVTHIRQGASLREVEDSISQSLAALASAEPAVIERMKRLRTLMLSDDRLRAEVAKSEGYLAGMDPLELERGEPTLQTRLMVEIAAATLRTAFDSWARTTGGGAELAWFYRMAREARADLLP
jgi:AcrR family transcriptional regulator